MLERRYDFHFVSKTAAYQGWVCIKGLSTGSQRDDDKDFMSGTGNSGARRTRPLSCEPVCLATTIFSPLHR